MPEQDPVNPDQPTPPPDQDAVTPEPADSAPAPKPQQPADETDDDIAAEAIESARSAIAGMSEEATAAAAGKKKSASPEGAASPDIPDFNPSETAALPDGLTLLSDVNLNVKIELGRTRMLVEDVLKLGEGAVVELDKLAGDPVDIFVNDRPVARGEVLVLNDNFCVRINEILAPVRVTAKGGPARKSA